MTSRRAPGLDYWSVTLLGVMAGIGLLLSGMTGGAIGLATAVAVGALLGVGGDGLRAGTRMFLPGLVEESVELLGPAALESAAFTVTVDAAARFGHHLGMAFQLVDDILDEGITLREIISFCRHEGARSVRTAVLVQKDLGRPAALEADHVGLVVENRYVFGCGMDYQAHFRHLPALYALKKSNSQD